MIAWLEVRLKRYANACRNFTQFKLYIEISRYNIIIISLINVAREHVLYWLE